MEAAIEAGADDVQSDEEGHTILCASKTSTRCPRRWKPRSAKPKASRSSGSRRTNVPVDEDRAQSLMKLVGNLEDDDDVQNVYANFEVDDATLAKLARKPRKNLATGLALCGKSMTFT
jgi:transcriptional/translational regulatory protein YebC/TACO1